MRQEIEVTRYFWNAHRVPQFVQRIRNVRITFFERNERGTKDLIKQGTET